ncbi:hypothetical protein ABC417_04915 [Brevundimonas sp. 1P8-tot-C-2]|uniref:hypothetical protein n=2 Tax=Brevundimonas TaxID=41275 RepID=UPI0039A1E02C
MTLFNLLPAELFVAATLVLSGGCGEPMSEQQRFVARDEKGQVIATVTMEQPLPAHDTSLTFDGPPEPGQVVLVEPMTFEDTGAFQCHWSKLIAICKTDEQEPAETRLVAGGYVRRLDAATVIVSDAPGDVAGDFATFHGGRLVAFGVLDRTGATAWRYDAL